MTDSELVAKKLGLVETCLQQLRNIAKPEIITSDVREERFVEHTLQLARIIHESPTAAAHLRTLEGENGDWLLDVLKVRLRGQSPFSPSRARICTTSLRTFMNNPG